MTALAVRLQEAGAGRDLAEAWLWRAAASWCVPVIDVTERVPGGSIEGEDAAEPATTYAAATAVPAALAGDGPRRFWCTWAVALPDANGDLARQPYLRLRGQPMALLATDPDALTLRLGPTPVWAPPDAPAPWQAAAERARAELAEAVTKLRAERAGLSVRVLDEGATAAATEVARALGAPAPEPAPWTPSPEPGPCLGCRHANQGTFDLTFDGVLACRFVGGRPLDALCEVTVEGGYAYEPWDGVNGTWFDQGDR